MLMGRMAPGCVPVPVPFRSSAYNVPPSGETDTSINVLVPIALRIVVSFDFSWVPNLPDRYAGGRSNDLVTSLFVSVLMTHSRSPAATYRRRSSRDSARPAPFGSASGDATGPVSPNPRENSHPESGMKSSDLPLWVL